MSLWSAVLRVVGAIALLFYPVFVWLGLSAGSARHVALVLLLVMAPALVLRLRQSARQAVRGLAAVPLSIVAVLAVAAVLDAHDLILAVPVCTNAVLLVAFGSTLRRGSMPMIERFARLTEKDLGPEQQAWCRLWTKAWCAFFVANGATAAALAALAPRSWWALYNGLVCYGLIGAMFALEWVLRRRRFPQLRHGKADRERIHHEEAGA